MASAARFLYIIGLHQVHQRVKYITQNPEHQINHEPGPPIIVPAAPGKIGSPKHQSDTTDKAGQAEDQGQKARTKPRQSPLDPARDHTDHHTNQRQQPFRSGKPPLPPTVEKSTNGLHKKHAATDDQRIAQCQKQQNQQIVEDLKLLVRIPSVAKHGEDGLPFGKAVDDVLSASARLFRDNGIPMEMSADRKYALAVLESEGDGIGVFAHGDVVPVNDDWIKTTPFDPIEENGILYGRGVGDNKCAIVGMLYAIRALQAAGVTLKSRITFYVGGCEEAGMEDIKAFAENERMPAVSVVPDGGFPVGIGEKSILRVICRSKDSLTDVVKLDGGKAFNTVLDHVEVELRSGETFAVDGVPAHASYPRAGVNAGGKAVEQLLPKVCDGDQKLLSAYAHAIGDVYGGNLDIATTGDFGKLTCANGISRVEDGHLVFTLDIRYGTELACPVCEERLRAALDHLGFTMEIKEHKYGFQLDSNAPELQILLDICRELFHRPDAKPIRMGGGTYARYLKNAWSIDACPGPHPECLPKGRGGPHQSDEALTVDTFLKVIETLALALARLDAHLQKKA